MALYRSAVAGTQAFRGCCHLAITITNYDYEHELSTLNF